MVSYAQLKDAKPGSFRKVGSAYQTLSGDIDDRLEVVGKQKSEVESAWTDSEGSAAAVESLGANQTKLSEAVDELGSVKSILEGLADEVQAAKAKLTDAAEHASKIPATINDDGSVSIDWAAIDAQNGGSVGSDRALLQRAKNSEANAVKEMIEEALTGPPRAARPTTRTIFPSPAPTRPRSANGGMTSPPPNGRRSWRSTPNLSAHSTAFPPSIATSPTGRSSTARSKLSTIAPSRSRAIPTTRRSTRSSRRRSRD